MGISSMIFLSGGSEAFEVVFNEVIFGSCDASCVDVNQIGLPLTDEESEKALRDLTSGVSDLFDEVDGDPVALSQCLKTIQKFLF